MLEINKIYNMDCIEGMKLIPDGSIDCIITDPPYGMNYVSSWRKHKHKKIIGDDNLNQDLLFNEYFRVLKNNTHIYVFCNEYCIGNFRENLIKNGFNIKRMLVWHKNNHTSGDLRGDYANITEYILFAHKGRKILNGGRDRNVLNYSRVNTDKHPTTKPVDLIEYLINKSSLSSETILDPFMGSGTTAVASINTNRNYIGFELDESYFNTANERISLSNASKPPSIFY